MANLDLERHELDPAILRMPRMSSGHPEQGFR
jgi:hypothetical protein